MEFRTVGKYIYINVFVIKKNGREKFLKKYFLFLIIPKNLKRFLYNFVKN